MLEHFAVVAPWDELAGRLVERYRDVGATRLVSYLAEASIESDPTNMARWGDVARAVAAA
jgi:hypothetical protein